MHIFQIQIHPNQPGEEVEYAKNGLIRTREIGLDFSEPRRRVIEDLGLDGIPMAIVPNLTTTPRDCYASASG